MSSDAKTVTQDMVAGSGNGLLRGGPVPIGDVICFEVAYDDLVRSSVAAGAQLLVVQTNNATFGHTAETYQQLAMGQLRAVESGRTVVQAATTGKSAVIGPDGVVRAESGPLFAPDILVETVPVRTATTLAIRLGAWPEYLLAALAAAGAVTVIGTDRRRRPTRAGPRAPRPAGRDGAGVTTPDRVLVIIPTYQERENIEPIVERVLRRGSLGPRPRGGRRQPGRHRQGRPTPWPTTTRACTSCTGPRRPGWVRPTSPVSTGPSTPGTTSWSRWTPTGPTLPNSCPGCWPPSTVLISCSARAGFPAARP